MMDFESKRPPRPLFRVSASFARALGGDRGRRGSVLHVSRCRVLFCVALDDGLMDRPAQGQTQGRALAIDPTLGQPPELLRFNALSIYIVASGS